MALDVHRFAQAEAHHSPHLGPAERALLLAHLGPPDAEETGHIVVVITCAVPKREINRAGVWPFCLPGSSPGLFRDKDRRSEPRHFWPSIESALTSQRAVRPQDLQNHSKTLA